MAMLNPMEWIRKSRGSQRLVLVVVCVALLLDNMLLTVVGKSVALHILMLMLIKKYKKQYDIHKKSVPHVHICIGVGWV